MLASIDPAFNLKKYAGQPVMRTMPNLTIHNRLSAILRSGEFEPIGFMESIC